MPLRDGVTPGFILGALVVPETSNLPTHIPFNSFLFPRVKAG